MSEEITKTNGQLNPFEAYGNAMSFTSIVGQLLRFSKFGEYLAGQDDDVIPAGTRLLVNMNSLQTGWIKWVDNKPAETKMGLLCEGYAPPSRDELGDDDESDWDKFDDGRAKDPWQFTNQVVMMDPDTESLYTFTTASKGGLSAIGEICKAFGARMREAPDEMPLVELGVRTYEHPKYGETRTPKFAIVEWIEPPSELTTAGTEEAPASKPQAAKKPQAKLAPPAKAKVAPKGKHGPGSKATRF